MKKKKKENAILKQRKHEGRKERRNEGRKKGRKEGRNERTRANERKKYKESVKVEGEERKKERKKQRKKQKRKKQYTRLKYRLKYPMLKGRTDCESKKGKNKSNSQEGQWIDRGNIFHSTVRMGGAASILICKKRDGSNRPSSDSGRRVDDVRRSERGEEVEQVPEVQDDNGVRESGCSRPSIECDTVISHLRRYSENVPGKERMYCPICFYWFDPADCIVSACCDNQLC